MKADEMMPQVIMMRAIHMRAPTRLQDHVARHFEDEVADEEDACAEAVDGVAELQVSRHLQLGEADVDPVEKGDDVADEQERDQVPGDLAPGRLLELPVNT